VLFFYDEFKIAKNTVMTGGDVGYCVGNKVVNCRVNRWNTQKNRWNTLL